MKYHVWFFFALAMIFPVFCRNVLKVGHCKNVELQASIASLVKELGIESPVVIDAGAFDGGDSIRMNQLWPAGVFHAFEPIPEIYNLLVESVAGYPNIKTYNVALGEFNGLGTMFSAKVKDPARLSPNECKLSGCSSLLEPTKFTMHFRFGSLIFDEQPVKVATLDDWAEQFGVDHVDVLWLDMQGFELPMMMASSKIFKTVKIVCAEVQFHEAYKGQAVYGEVKSWLEDQGFMLAVVDFIDGRVSRDFENGCKVYEGNAIFVRKD